MMGYLHYQLVQSCVHQAYRMYVNKQASLDA